MNVFLVITSLGLLFYFVLLGALYRDGRKRRADHAAGRKMTAATIAEVNKEIALRSPTAATSRSGSTTVRVHYVGIGHRPAREAQAAASDRAKVVARPAFVRGPEGLQRW